MGLFGNGKEMEEKLFKIKRSYEEEMRGIYRSQINLMQTCDELKVRVKILEEMVKELRDGKRKDRI